MAVLGEKHNEGRPLPRFQDTIFRASALPTSFPWGVFVENSNLGTTLACGGTWDSTKFVSNKRSKVLCCMLQNRGRGFRFHCSEYICYLRRIRCKQTCGHRFVLLSSGRGPGPSENNISFRAKRYFYTVY